VTPGFSHVRVYAKSAPAGIRSRSLAPSTPCSGVAHRTARIRVHSDACGASWRFSEEVCHSWFNRLRKPLVRYEKLERSVLALNHLAAAIIAFRKVPLGVNIIYG
jgi:hypothetical protein